MPAITQELEKGKAVDPEERPVSLARDTMRIGLRWIGQKHPTYIIAEIGINHNGDIELAKTLIDVAAAAQVDAVKFQKRHLPSVYRKDILHNTVKYEQAFQYMIPVLQHVELSEDDMAFLKAYAESKGLEFLCTPFDRQSLAFLEELGVNAFKVASADLTNLELLESMAAFGKPMLVSTGMSRWEEIKKSVAFLEGLPVPFALLHCRSVYPVRPRDANLRKIEELKQFGCPVGYSSHDMGTVLPLVAVSMGASIIEKHVTLDKGLKGPDHRISLEPDELKRLVRDIRTVEAALSPAQGGLLSGEIMNRELFGKSLIAACPIQSGTVITRGMIRIQGPGKGLSPPRLHDLIGRTLRRNLDEGQDFLEEDIGSNRSGDFKHAFQGRWGLICRFSDVETMLAYEPRVVEFHLAERDLGMNYTPRHCEKRQLVVHVPEYMPEGLVDLCSLKAETRKRSVETVHETIWMARRLAAGFSGVPKVIVHPGGMSLNGHPDTTALGESLMRSLDEINAEGVILLLENMPPYPWYFGGQWQSNFFMDALEIRDVCRERELRICLDLSHAALYCNASGGDLCDYIETLRPFVEHLHVADACGLDAEGLQIGDGDIPFDEVLPLFKGYEGTWVPEIWRGHCENGKGFVEALRRLKRYPL
ncbi:MAG: N-acetylneuraminate synthase family protein [Deltaproteobacteria bacterium]|nr:N-acetylneuraminate synthase family protein [Deltaproteobacteria bacterium]